MILGVDLVILQGDELLHAQVGKACLFQRLDVVRVYLMVPQHGDLASCESAESRLPLVWLLLRLGVAFGAEPFQ